MVEKHNPLYSNIDISKKRLNALPVDGDISYEKIKKVPVSNEFDNDLKLNEPEEDSEDENIEGFYDEQNVDDICDEFSEPTSFEDYDTYFNQDRDEEKMFEVPDDFVSKNTFTKLIQNKLFELDETKINENEEPDYSDFDMMDIEEDCDLKSNDAFVLNNVQTALKRLQNEQSDDNLDFDIKTKS